MLTPSQPKFLSLVGNIRSKYRELNQGYRSIYKIGIIIAVLLLSAAFALIATPKLALLFVLAIVGSAFLIVDLRYPSIGLLAIIFATMFVPSLGDEESGILNAAILSTAFLTILWIIDMLVRQRQIKLAPSKTTTPTLVFAVVSIIALLNGQLLYSTLTHNAPIRSQIGGLGLFLLSFAAFLLIANQIKDQIWLQRFTWLFLALGGFYVLIGRLPPLQFSDPIRALFQYGSDASIFWIWLVAMTSSQAFYNRNLDRRWRFVLLGLLVSTFYVSLSQAYDWKSGWFPAAIGLLVIIWLGYPRLRLPAIFVAFFLALFSFTNLEGVFIGGEDYSILTRFPAWNIVLEIFKLNPVFGIGIANYYWYTPIYQILGYTGLNFSSHNNYIDILAQMGIIGLICFTWFFWQAGLLGWQLKKIVPQGFAYAYVIGALGGIVGTLVSGMMGDWIIPFVYNVGANGFRSSIFAWLFMGGLVVLEQIYVHNKEEPDKAT